MKERKTEQQFIDAIKHNFDQSVDQIDVDIVPRLNTIRHSALGSADKKYSRRILIPAGAMVAVSIALIVFTLVQPDLSSSSFMADDIEILSTSDGIDFYENLEFYQWLQDYEIST